MERVMQIQHVISLHPDAKDIAPLKEGRRVMRTAESLAHLAYGEIVKRFHLGTAHIFNSWDRLSEDERARWVGVFTEVRRTLTQEANEKPPLQ